MIQISKEQSEYIREHAPNANIMILNRHAPSRKKSYIVEESDFVFRLLKRFRTERENVIETHGYVQQTPEPKVRNKHWRKYNAY